MGISKIIKAADHALSENALLKEENRGFKRAQENARVTAKRKRIAQDPNRVLFDREAVMRARKKEKNSNRTQQAAEHVSLQVEKITIGGMTFKDMQFEFFQ